MRNQRITPLACHAPQVFAGNLCGIADGGLTALFDFFGAVLDVFLNSEPMQVWKLMEALVNSRAR
uniref:Uncharacterized protein n=1 Tax=mine drainage metagenome TaxID=410659 RepID=E6PLI2_9ZZZZ